MEYFSFQRRITGECDQRCKHCRIFLENECKKPAAMAWPQIEDGRKEKRRVSPHGEALLHTE